jgi:hypothetical protein
MWNQNANPIQSIVTASWGPNAQLATEKGGYRYTGGEFRSYLRSTSEEQAFGYFSWGYEARRSIGADGKISVEVVEREVTWVNE